MKKILLLNLFITLFSTVSAQTLNRNENWPNALWTISGTYTPAALIFNPTVNDKLKFDSMLVSPLGSPSVLFAASPVVNLKPAFDAGEKALRLDFSISYGTTADFVLAIQYWNADTSAWVLMKDGNAPIGGQGTVSNCTNVMVNIYFDFSGFTTNQLQNFRYRLAVNDTGNQLSGVCVNSPSLISFSCPAPSNLLVTNINTLNVTLDWTGIGTNFEIEYGLQGFVLGNGTRQQINIHPFEIGNLTPATNYDFYVREDCSNSKTIISGWGGPKSFTTASLSIKENVLKGFRIYPNPAKDMISMDSEKIMNEIAIINLLGQEVMRIKPYKLHANIDLSSLNIGCYFVKVTIDSDSGTYRIMKN